MSKSNTITLSRAEYEALLDRIEDAEDRAIVAAAEAREKALGKEQARADALPLELATALAEGTHPVRVWRKHRDLTLSALAARADIAQSYLTEIETRKKPGSLDAMIKIAAALEISLDDLAAWLSAKR
ncbi:MAG: helix-turn-helix domain-containing protein [Stellaceae bacterium]